VNFGALGIDLSRAVGGGAEVKTTCPQCSHTRKKKTDRCLNVNTSDGVYHCWHCGWSGKVPGEERMVQPTPKIFTKPKLVENPLSAPAIAWFKTRGIEGEVLARNRISSARVFMPQVGSEVGSVAFPYLRGGEVVNCKYRDSKKHFRMESGAERLLYGYDDIQPTTIIVEGEMDKLAVEMAGFKNCVSVPDGAPAPNSKNLESKFDYLGDERLQSVERWIVAVDNDAPGQRLRDELVRRFGAEKCLVVTWPEGCKDANDVLMTRGADTLRDCLDRAEPVPIVGVFDANAFAGDLLERYDEGVPTGLTTGWQTLDEYWRVKAGQLVVVTGIPGQGKSEWVDALCINLAQHHGWRTALYSPENQPTWLHLMKLVEKFVGRPFNPGPSPRMSREEATAGKDWINEHFTWILPEQPSLDEIIDKARALILRKGIRVLVIDPWNEVEHSRPAGMTEAEYVSQSLMRLRRFARKHEVLLIVVAHPKLLEKKNDGSYPVPTPYDISGGAMWRNKADNSITIYSPDVTNPEGYVEAHIQKVKFKLYGRVGMVPFKWDRVTGRYHEIPSLRDVNRYRNKGEDE
jgi:twinkle protein